MNKLEYDAQADAAYVCLSRRAIARTVPLSDRLALDVARDQSVVGVEILSAKGFFSDVFGFLLDEGSLRSLTYSVHENHELHLHFECQGHKAALALAKIQAELA